MNNKIKTLVAGVGLIFASSTFAAGGLQSESRLAKTLELTPQQQKQIHVIQQQAQKNLDSIKRNDVDRDLILNVIKSGKWDEFAVKKRIAEMSVVKQQADYIRFHYFFEVMQTLTSAQKDKLQKMIK
jgi:Spy/CpxP family protein refolding chaperone